VPKATTARPAGSRARSRAVATSRPRTASKVSPASVERRIPSGPASRTVRGDGAWTAAGRAVVPVSSGRHVVPASAVRKSPPAVSSAKPADVVGKVTSRRSSEVDTLPRVHVRPPSVVVASVPLSPGA
jgi:hypothetical protein